MNTKNTLNALNSLVFKRRPVYVHYGITHRCNLRCRMCHIYKDGSSKEELSPGQIDRVFDLLKRMGISYVSIGGGEPFLREDLPDVVDMLIKKGLRVRLLTNGTLSTEDNLAELISRGLREFSVSLDTLNPERQAYIHDDADSWKKIMACIERLLNFLAGEKSFLLLNTVVSPFNIDELPRLHDFARSKGLFISFVPIESGGSSEFAFNGGYHERIDRIYDHLIREKRSARNRIFNTTLFLEKSRQYLKSGKHDWRCDAGRLYYSVNPKGELSICHNFPPLFSLLDLSSDDLPMLKNKRDGQKQADGCEGCMRPCWAEISFISSDRKSFAEMARLHFSYQFQKMR